MTNHPDFQDSLTIMNAHQTKTSLLRHIIPYDASDEHPRLEKIIAQTQRNKCYVKRFAAVMALFPLLAIAGVGYEMVLQENSPYNGSHPGIRLLSVLGLASLICLVALAGVLKGYSKKLSRSQKECRQLVKTLLESHLRNPHIASLSGNHAGSDTPEAVEAAAKTSGYHGNLDSPSWTSNRMCG